MTQGKCNGSHVLRFVAGGEGGVRRAIVTKWGPAIGWRVKLMADQSHVRTQDTLTRRGAMRIARRFERTGR